MEVLPLAHPPVRSYDQSWTGGFHGEIINSAEEEFGEFLTTEEFPDSNLTQSDGTSHEKELGTDFKAYSGHTEHAEPKVHHSSSANRAASGDQPPRSDRNQEKLAVLPVSDGQRPLVAGLFKPSEDFLLILDECTQLLNSLEELEGPALMDKVDKAKHLEKLVKRIGFELRLMGSYKSLPEFEIYTDLNVRCFDLQTKVQILASKAEDANTENAELSPEETGLIKAKNRSKRPEQAPRNSTLGYLNSKLARKALRIAHSISSATKTRSSQFVELSPQLANKPINRFGTALKIGFSLTSLCIILAVFYSVLMRRVGH